MDHSPETIAHARSQYLAGERVATIQSDNNMTRHTLYYWLDGGPPSGEEHLPPLPRRAGLAPREGRRLSGNRLALVRRIWRAAEGQVRDIEDRLAAADQEPPERERDARMLAVLVKTLRELVEIDESRSATKPRAESDNDDMPRDIDEFRRELVRRMEAIIAARADEAAGGAR